MPLISQVESLVDGELTRDFFIGQHCSRRVVVQMAQLTTCEKTAHKPGEISSSFVLDTSYLHLPLSHVIDLLVLQFFSSYRIC